MLTNAFFLSSCSKSSNRQKRAREMGWIRMTGKFSTPHFVINSSIKLPILTAAEVETWRQYEAVGDSGVDVAIGLVEVDGAAAAAACLARMRIIQLCIALRRSQHNHRECARADQENQCHK